MHVAFLQSILNDVAFKEASIKHAIGLSHLGQRPFPFNLMTSKRVRPTTISLLGNSELVTSASGFRKTKWF